MIVKTKINHYYSHPFKPRKHLSFFMNLPVVHSSSLSIGIRYNVFKKVVLVVRSLSGK